jgi:hypothetical protein
MILRDAAEEVSERLHPAIAFGQEATDGVAVLGRHPPAKLRVNPQTKSFIRVIRLALVHHRLPVLALPHVTGR